MENTTTRQECVGQDAHGERQFIEVTSEKVAEGVYVETTSNGINRDLIQLGNGTDEVWGFPLVELDEVEALIGAIRRASMRIWRRQGLT